MFKTKIMIGTMMLMTFLLVPNNVHATETLQEKITAADPGDVIVLDKDYDEYLTIKKDITIDLAGHKITANSDGWELINIVSSKLTIMDSVGTGKIIQTEGGNAIQLNVDYDAENEKTANETEGKATLILESGTIESNEFGVSLFNNSEFIMNGGKIVSTGVDTHAICGNGTIDATSSNYGVNAKIVINGGIIESNNYAIYSPQKDGVTTINGGTITGTAGAVAMNRGSLTVNGGTLTSSGTHEQITQNVSGSSGADFATNAVIAIPARYALDTEKVNVTVSGTAKLIAEGNAEVISTAITENAANENFIEATKTNTEAEVAGGIISGDLDESYLAEGLELVKNDDGTYAVKKPAVPTPVVEENPKTSDGVLLYVVLGLISLLGLSGTGLYFKKRFN